MIYPWLRCPETAADARGWLRFVRFFQEILDLHCSFREKATNDIPNLIVLDVIVAVRQPVTKADDLAIISDARGCCWAGAFQTNESFTNNLEAPLDRLSETAVRLVVSKRAIRCLIANERAGIGNVVKRLQ